MLVVFPAGTVSSWDWRRNSVTDPPWNRAVARIASMTKSPVLPLYFARKRKKKTSNEDWISPVDGDAEITKLKDGRTALAYKAENAVDMETGAIVAVTTHSGAAADTTTVIETVIEAGVAS